ncbi:unnamed protein product [Mytilus coruscus]|uniref:Uncharacterized protein n=1 Tax=Mytilus coruscus TaxID=42192 RepID=A0A6J8DDJ3_MYTCO|nr:unnamed protein product [Mytilus coruscus]
MGNKIKRIGFLLCLLFARTLCEKGIVKIHRDKIFSGHVMFEASMPTWLPCAQLCSRIQAWKSINFIAWNKTCQISNDETGSHTGGLVETVGLLLLLNHHFERKYFVASEIAIVFCGVSGNKSLEIEGPCKGHECKLNEIYLPKARVHICIPLIAPFDDSEKHISTLTVDNGGSLGDWSYVEYCSEGHFAIEYEMKIEGNQGGDGDDSALNAIRLQCSNPDWKDSNNISVTIIGKEGPFGMWKDVAMCPYGEVMVSFPIHCESLTNGDNSASNYVRFKCRNIDSPSSGTILGTSVLWGDYGAWSEYCAVGSAICGIKVRIQLPQGVIIDDSALKDVQFFLLFLT